MPVTERNDADVKQAASRSVIATLSAGNLDRFYWLCSNLLFVPSVLDRSFTTAKKPKWRKSSSIELYVSLSINFRKSDPPKYFGSLEILNGVHEFFLRE